MRLDRGRHGGLHVGRRHGAFRRRRLKAGCRCEKHQCHNPTNTFHCSRSVCPGGYPPGLYKLRGQPIEVKRLPYNRVHGACRLSYVSGRRPLSYAPMRAPRVHEGVLRPGLRIRSRRTIREAR